jgi:polyphosphate kinase 2 (PPK2 family)
MKAYEDTIRHTATKNAPWYVVPADNKWFTASWWLLPSSKLSIRWA